MLNMWTDRAVFSCSAQASEVAHLSGRGKNGKTIPKSKVCCQDLLANNFPYCLVSSIWHGIRFGVNFDLVNQLVWCYDRIIVIVVTVIINYHFDSNLDFQYLFLQFCAGSQLYSFAACSATLHIFLLSVLKLF